MKFIVFPGQASQYSGMGKDWFDNFKAAKSVFEEASDSCSLNLKKLCFEGSEADLKSTEITQPAILTTCIAIWRSLGELMDVDALVKNSLFAGHSLGEYSALVAAGVVDLSAAVSFVNKRGMAMQEAVPAGQGGMMALLFKPRSENTLEVAKDLCEKASKLSESNVWLANVNGAEQIVVAGSTKALKAAQVLANEGDNQIRQAVPLEVSAPFHCPMMSPAADKLKPLIDETVMHASSARYVSNVDAKVYSLESDFDGVKQRLFDQISSPVLWWQSAQTALNEGCELALEVGPKKVLSSLCRRVESNGKKFKTVNLDRREDWEIVQSSLGS
ncbi:ACP S-malonyltransferase [bacterium]|nr:ACP S-malonyltransferase [bacterium]